MSENFSPSTRVSERPTGVRAGIGAERGEPVYWRVEGSLLQVGAMRPVGFFTWNSQSFSERWARRLGMAGMALTRPFAYAASRTFATRFLHTLLRGVSRDRLDLLGEEYFQYVLKPDLRKDASEKLLEAVRSGQRVVLVGQLLDHIMRPLAWVAGGSADGRISREKLLQRLGWTKSPEKLKSAEQSSVHPVPPVGRAVALLGDTPRVDQLSVRQTLAGKHILLVGVTGFIGKVWLVDLLENIPDIGRITLLIRRNRTTSGQRRFEKIVEESPTLDPLQEKYGRRLGAFLKEKVEVVEGDVSQPGLGMDPETQARLQKSLDLVVNSAGLTDFNPDLRDAIASNVDSTLNLIDFLRKCDHAGLMHLSTCYVVGMRDGRVDEYLEDNYNPKHDKDFRAAEEIESLREMIRNVEERSQSPELTKGLQRQALGRGGDASKAPAAELDGVLKRNRARWAKNRLTRAGLRRAQHLGWPNTYTFTKSLGESVLSREGKDLAIAVVRPSIVESSTRSPFPGWNEGINTSGPLSYLLGTNFRQLPTNARKCLDVIPVDMVCRGMSLIAAAVIARKNARMYQLATSAVNPVNMGRSIELTGLAHRKYYKRQPGIDPWLKVKFETIPVSKQRYERMSIPMQKAVVSRINRAATTLHMKKGPLARAERDLGRAEKLIELYEPFILHNEHVFECENARLLSAALPPDEKHAFEFDPESIDWWNYWINIHIPALRRWCYPLMEGRPLESRTPREMDWSSQSQAAPARASAAGSSAQPADPLWRSS